MKGCLLIPLAFAISFTIGMVAGLFLGAAIGNEKLAGVIATGVWLFSFLVLLLYGSLWFSNPADFLYPPKSDSLLGDWRSRRRESKLEAAELRVAIVFGILGGGLSAVADAPTYASVLVIVSCAIVGFFLGFDFKKRVLRRREAYERETNLLSRPESLSHSQSDLLREE